MCQETLSDTRIRFGTSKRIVVFGSKIDFIPMGQSMGFLQTWPNFELGISYLLMSLGISECRKTPLGIIFSCK